ncbi:MAG: hypothetical protein RR807_04305, partial [Oscillospiraceae bacterium]
TVCVRFGASCIFVILFNLQGAHRILQRIGSQPVSQANFSILPRGVPFVNPFLLFSQSFLRSFIVFSGGPRQALS